MKTSPEDLRALAADTRARPADQAASHGADKPSPPSGDHPSRKFRFELWEIERAHPDIQVTMVEGELRRAAAEIQHYAMMYAQDGPVAIKGPFPC